MKNIVYLCTSKREYKRVYQEFIYRIIKSHGDIMEGRMARINTIDNLLTGKPIVFLSHDRMHKSRYYWATGWYNKGFDSQYTIVYVSRGSKWRKMPSSLVLPLMAEAWGLPADIVNNCEWGII